MKKNQIFPNKNQCLFCLHKLVFSPYGKFFHTSHLYCNALSINCIDGFYLKDGNCDFFERKHKNK